jgi:cyclopropane-fatty-acyl-phospholipid synthase
MNGIATNEQQVFEKSPSLSARWAKTIFTKLVANIRYGQIVLQDGEQMETFGDDKSMSVHVTVLNQRFYSKVLLGGSIGAGEAYVENLWKVDDLTMLVQIMARNMALLDELEQKFFWVYQPFRILKHKFNHNSKVGSKRNIISHYDLGNEMYRSFLDPTMMYSSAMYPKKTSSLEEASLHKLETICKKLDLQPSDKVIEIGSGWCGFAIYAAAKYGCHVTTVTISEAQYQEGKKRIEEAGLSDRITLLKQDYRDLTGSYDKLVSIEMIEAVGHRYHPQFFSKCNELLKDNGIMLIQAITMKDQGYEQYIKTVDFIQRHIFPGGCLPSNNRMLQLVSSETDMVVRQLDDFGFDYARTLREWRNRFNQSFSGLRNKGYDDTFKRLWNFYLCYCEGGFLERAISVVHLVATRPNNRSTFG